MELVNEAIIFAAKAHDGTKRKREELPYILHPMEVAVIVGAITNRQEVIAAALLHDTVEDAEVAPEEIEKRFGKRVAELVAAETENKRRNLPEESTWKIRKEETLSLLKESKDIDVKILYLGDKLANMRSVYRLWKKDGHAMWRYFNQKDPSEQAWYYRSVLEGVKELSDTAAYLEYKELINKVFSEVTK